ncbi:hypothetical protein HOP50_02g15410 [Chloropicon primus]|uniref:Uncharacterized protein n=1 Tax=Chloropicon primus TaxID=1764295 RepID=A0A5B8MI30_9CHLO|nr:hypothetical protein A3770_02p15500 [Chloropicon primus]UPQ98241.1 hypothetical protein HOP50_02g15410 [Chloropicon primus]|eukprot:QDZ19032.1 hypothetical protein A3770_02p15500 [Chloropicon primus]
MMISEAGRVGLSGGVATRGRRGARSLPRGAVVGHGNRTASGSRGCSLGVQRQRSRATTTMGLPVVGWFLNPVTLFIAYAFGGARFASGYRNTSYNNNFPTKAVLTALWPLAFAVSASFRSNFKRAVKL